MAEFIVMPKLGLTMTEGTISNWRKAEGEHIEQGDILFDVETDKLSNEIEAKVNGVLRKILVQEGEIEVFRPVAIIGSQDEDISALLSGEGGNVQGGADKEVLPEATEFSDTPVTSDDAGKADGRIIASPLAKKTAGHLAVDLALVQGTGPGGRIIEADVQQAAATKGDKRTKASPTAVKTAAALGVDISGIQKDGRIMKTDVQSYYANAHQAEVANGTAEEARRVPMNAMRKVIARRMLESQRISPTVTYNMKVDTTNLALLREQLKDTYKVTYTDLLVKIAAKVLIEYPLLNCSIENDELVLRNYVNIGVAVGLDEGLVVPVVKHADRKGLREMSEEVQELVAKARNNGLAPSDMSGGTFTITNLGMYGMESFTPIINQPEVAILGVNAIIETPVAENGQVTVKPLMNLSLTADHRAVDGAVAAGFMQKLKKYIEKPALLLL